MTKSAKLLEQLRSINESRTTYINESNEIESLEVPARGSGKFKYRGSTYHAMPRNAKKFVADLMKNAEIEAERGNTTVITPVKWIPGWGNYDTELATIDHKSPMYHAKRPELGWINKNRTRESFSESDLIELFDTPEFVGYIHQVHRRPWW